MKLFYKLLSFAALIAVLSMAFISCEKDEPNVKIEEEPTKAEQKYVIAAVADNVTYLLTTNSLDKGTVSVKGQGTEVIGGTYWIFNGDKYVFGLTYNKGGAGTGASYFLNKEGKPQEKYEYTFKRITTYGFWGDNLITCSTGNSSEYKDADGNPAQSFLFNYLNTTDGSNKEAELNSENLLGNGEKTSFAGFVEANGMLYTSVVPMGMSKYGISQWPDKVTDPELVTKTAGGSGSGSYSEGVIPSTQYPDRAYIAIFKDSFDEKPIIAETDKMGFACGRNRSQYYQTIGADDNGNLYVFSSGYGRTFKSTDELKKVTGTKPSAVMRIKKGQTTFDDSYYVNIESLGNKKALFKAWHIVADNFLLQMYDDEITKTDVTALSLAVYQAETKTLIPVTGLPNKEVISSFGNTPFMDNGFAYMPVSVIDGNGRPALYKIDMATGKAVKGLEVETNEIRGVGLLTPHE